MEVNRMSEAEAYRFLQKYSMDAGRKLVRPPGCFWTGTPTDCPAIRRRNREGAQRWDQVRKEHACLTRLWSTTPAASGPWWT